MTATREPLDRIDPDQAWRPWKPTAADPWGRKWIAHLYRRAAFGASREELIEAEKLGPDGTLDLLLHGRPDAASVLQTLNDVGRVAANRGDGGDELRGWWLYAMLHGGHPLREKLTLLWHNHFATSIAKVKDAELMFRQNGLFRDHALGKFGTLLQSVGRDPAMLVWLDSNSNVKGRANENYAREVMELFSLGVGHYAEKDIREAARAFTGWHTNGGKFRFDAAQHDDGPKAFLGQSGNWDGDDVVRIILEQPAAARFVVNKLYAMLMSETAPPDALVEPLCVAFRRSDYDIAAVVKTILSSRHFYSDHAFRRRIKSPVEFVLGAVRAVYRNYSEGSAEYRPLPHRLLVPRLAAMGQTLFAPPNVKGWPGGRTWLNTSTVVERSNFAASVATGAFWEPSSPAFNVSQELSPPAAFDPARLLGEENVTQPADVVRVLLDLYAPGGVRPEAREKLTAFVADGKPAGRDLERRTREAVHAILSMPEYQLA